MAPSGCLCALLSLLPLVEAQTWSGGGFSVKTQTMKVDAGPYDPDALDTNLVPGGHAFVYGARHRFFAVKDAAGKQGVIWQTGDAKACYLTWHEGESAKNLKLPCEDGELLVAATHNSKDAVVFVGLKHSGQCGSGPNGCQIASIRLVKAKMSDGMIMGSAMDLPRSKFDFKGSTASMASIEWNSNNIMVLHLASEMSSAHYSARSAAFNGDTLATLGGVSQTASHSWGHSMTTLSDGRVWVVDECDNFPRGFPVTEVGADGKTGRGKRLPYRFKQKAGNSNDNNIYNKLANRALVELGDRVALVFSGEGMGHTSTDGTKAVKRHNEAYNLATVIFDKSLTGDKVFSTGPVETGSYVDYSKKTQTITHKGVTWLTKRTGMDKNVLRAKTFKAPGDKIVIIYEEWTAKAFGGKVFVMAIDKTGKIVMPETEIPSSNKIRLTPADDIISFDGKTAVFYRGQGNNLVRYSLSVGDVAPGKPPVSTGGSTTKPSGGNTTKPSGGNTTMPSGGNTTMPSGGNTTMPSGGNTTMPSGGNTTMPSGGNTTMPLGENTPSGGSTTPGSGSIGAETEDGKKTTIIMIVLFVVAVILFLAAVHCFFTADSYGSRMVKKLYASGVSLSERRKPSERKTPSSKMKPSERKTPSSKVKSSERKKPASSERKKPASSERKTPTSSKMKSSERKKLASSERKTPASSKMKSSERKKPASSSERMKSTRRNPSSGSSHMKSSDKFSNSMSSKAYRPRKLKQK